MGRTRKIKMKSELSENDRAEIELFRLYLQAYARWNQAFDDLPDFASVSEIEEVLFQKKTINAHAAIYEQIYGEKP